MMILETSQLVAELARISNILQAATVSGVTQPMVQ